MTNSNPSVGKFPTQAFLEQHFGPNRETGVTFNGTYIPIMTHEYLQREFDGCLRTATMRIMRQVIDKRGIRFQGIRLVKDGRLRSWAIRSLEREFGAFPESSYTQLAQELIAYYNNTPFRHDSWWEWFVTENSLGARTAPHANPAGNNRPRRTWEDFLKGRSI